MIILSLDSRTLTVPRHQFLARTEGYDRWEIRADGNEDTGAVDYSSYGTPKIDGGAVVNKHAWQLKFLLPAADYYALRALWQEHRSRERSFANWQITLVDEMERVVDEGDRLRAKAEGTDEIAVVGGGVAYYAKFQVRMSEPRKEPFGNPAYPNLVRLQLFELEAIAP